MHAHRNMSRSNQGIPTLIPEKTLIDCHKGNAAFLPCHSTFLLLSTVCLLKRLLPEDQKIRHRKNHKKWLDGNPNFPRVLTRAGGGNLVRSAFVYGSLFVTQHNCEMEYSRGFLPHSHTAPLPSFLTFVPFSGRNRTLVV